MIEPSPPVETVPPGSARPVLLVPADTFGRGEHPELGQLLCRNFFHALTEARPLPALVILLNSGAKLAVEGSPVLEDLRCLQDLGVRLLVCGTCLNHYGLKDRLAAGEISNMYEIAEALLAAPRIVTL